MATYDLDIYVNGTKYSDNLISYKLVERLNQVPYIEANFVDILTANTDVVYGKWIAIKSDNSGNWVSPKLMLSEVGDLSDDFVDVKAEGWVERKLKDFLVTNTASADVNSQAGRPQYNSESVSDIVTEQLAAYTTGVSAGTLVTTAITIRSEGDSLISFISGSANVASTDWYGSYSSDLATSSINVTARGSDNSATIILNASGVSQNCEAGERTQNYDLLKNVVHVRGYGDGINQLESKCFHATSIRNKLASAMTATQNTAVLVSSSGFPNNGSVWIGCEKCNYTGRSGNTLTGLTRGVAFQGNVSKAYAHAVNSPVYDAQYTEASPQSTGNGSSINTHGIKMESFELREVIDQSTLDILAEKLLTERKGTTTSYLAPESILVYPEDYVWGKENIVVGDEITINDSEAGLSGKYRVYGSTLSYDSGVYSLELEVSNVTQSVLSEIKDDANKGVTLSKYMQGATNIYQINLSENCSSGKYLNLRFYLPPEAIAINYLKLNFKLKSFRAYNTANANESAHTHSIPSLTVNSTSTVSNTSGSVTPNAISGVSVWNAFTVRYADGNNKALAYSYNNTIGSQSYYTTRVQCLLMNITGSTQSVTPYFELPSTGGGSFTVNYSLTNNTVMSWETGVSDSDNEIGWYKCYDDNFNCSLCTGQIGNIYTHTHGTHSHSIPSLTVNGTTTQSKTSSAGSAHTHGITYGIYEETLSSPSVDIYFGVDGSESFVSKKTTDQTDMTLSVSNLSPGNWYNVQFRPNKNMRIESNLYIQIFINSR